MNQHRGSDFNEFLAQENLMTPTPCTDAIAHRGLGHFAYIAEMTKFACEIEADLATERALADRLAGVLLSYDHNMLAGDDMQWLPEHDKALAAWREARK